MEYIKEHYFHYNAKSETSALATGRKSLTKSKKENEQDRQRKKKASRNKYY